MTTRIHPELSQHAEDFIHDERIARLIETTRPDAARVREIIAKSLAKEALTVEETAALLAAESAEQIGRAHV